MTDLEADLLAALRDLYRAYVNTIEAGRDRIIFLGGDCDPVEVMEAGDPALLRARITIARVEPPETNQGKDAT